MTYTLHCGDCLDILPTLPAQSVDTVITDPPYGLSFMGKDWDHGIPGVQFWREALRVAKPGAMLLAFGGSRTFHRLTCAIEDAGWEIRDCLMWLYGSGFPKSLDISKAIDKAAGAERVAMGLGAYAARRPASRRVEDGGDPVDFHFGGGDYVTAPATPAAQQWHGWGTALKPAWEPIILAMKPLDGTFANNALTWGVAGLNVDGARIPITDGATMARNNKPGDNGWKNSSGGPNAAALNGEPSGRWPANLLLDEAAAAMVDAQSGEQTSSPYSYGKKSRGGIMNITDERRNGSGYSDTGGASRFFYVAKASRGERGDDNTHPTVKPLTLMRYLCKLTATPTGGVVLDPFMGSGTTGVACAMEGRNFIGVELDAGYYEIARRRIEAVQPSLLQAAD